MIRIALAAVTAVLTTAITAAAAQKTTTGSGAFIRSLDRITGDVVDYEMRNGSSEENAFLKITLRDCRYPQRRLDEEAYAYLVIEDKRVEEPVFQGWMVASSPALSALEHPRYDVWVLRCRAPE